MAVLELELFCSFKIPFVFLTKSMLQFFRVTRYTVLSLKLGTEESVAVICWELGKYPACRLECGKAAIWNLEVAKSGNEFGKMRVAELQTFANSIILYTTSSQVIPWCPSHTHNIVICVLRPVYMHRTSDQFSLFLGTRF